MDRPTLSEAGLPGRQQKRRRKAQAPCRSSGCPKDGETMEQLRAKDTQPSYGNHAVQPNSLNLQLPVASFYRRIGAWRDHHG